jgi:hypothetical protein
MCPGALQKFERTCKDFPHRKYLKHSYQSLFSDAQFRKKKQVSGEPRTRAVKFKEILTCCQKKKMLTCDRSDFCFAQPACLSFSVLCSVSCCYSSSFSWVSSITSWSQLPVCWRQPVRVLQCDCYVDTQTWRKTHALCFMSMFLTWISNLHDLPASLDSNQQSHITRDTESVKTVMWVCDWTVSILQDVTVLLQSHQQSEMTRKTGTCEGSQTERLV